MKKSKLFLMFTNCIDDEMKDSKAELTKRVMSCQMARLNSDRNAPGLAEPSR